MSTGFRVDAPLHGHAPCLCASMDDLQSMSWQARRRRELERRSCSRPPQGAAVRIARTAFTAVEGGFRPVALRAGRRGRCELSSTSRRTSSPARCARRGSRSASMTSSRSACNEPGADGPGCRAAAGGSASLRGDLPASGQWPGEKPPDLGGRVERARRRVEEAREPLTARPGVAAALDREQLDLAAAVAARVARPRHRAAPLARRRVGTAVVATPEVDRRADAPDLVDGDGARADVRRRTAGCGRQGRG